MKVEYISPFIEAAQSVIKMLFGVDAKSGEIYQKVSPFHVGQIIILIGVTGRIKGQVCFELSEETAKKVASSMMGGIPLVQLDEIGKSAISEMGNMIMGNASTILANKAIHIDITPPSLLTGENIGISNKVPTLNSEESVVLRQNKTQVRQGTLVLNMARTAEKLPIPTKERSRGTGGTHYGIS